MNVCKMIYDKSDIIEVWEGGYKSCPASAVGAKQVSKDAPALR